MKPKESSFKKKSSKDAKFFSSEIAEKLSHLQASQTMNTFSQERTKMISAQHLNMLSGKRDVIVEDAKESDDNNSGEAGKDRKRALSQSEH